MLLINMRHPLSSFLLLPAMAIIVGWGLQHVSGMAISVAKAAASAAATTEEELGLWPIMARGAFTPAECDAITQLYTSQLSRVLDERTAESVSRINRFDVDQKLLKKGDLEWILARVAAQLPVTDDGTATGARLDSAKDLTQAIDFTLLHEFNPGMHFGLHVDTKPNDGTFRTFNINVMCSDPADYVGGELQVGDSVVEGLQKGDLYMYPASLPHAVLELGGGVRYTYIMALQVPLTTGADADANADNTNSQALRQRYQETYWTATEARMAALGISGRMGEQESKLHLIHAQFLEASGDRTEQAIDAEYCRAYKATPEAALYAQQFFQDGLEIERGGNAKMAETYFVMAACIDPSYANKQQANDKAAGKKKRAFGAPSNPDL